ncbi:MAG: protein-glutamate O-methyltransferase CheR [Parvularcula sp.]|nr:protein-glutamate O-methyltransferase CheR [Parvularcula sp.]
MPQEQRIPEFPFTDDDFRQISGMLYDDAGIFLPDTKQNLVYSRLARRVRALGLKSFAAYVKHIRTREGRSEREHLVNALTTNLTHFFREPHHFETIRQQVVPEALAKTKNGGRYRVWSAGCSSGEEPYSLALAFLDAAPELAERDFKILATDIDSEVVERAKRGTYTKDVVAPVPQHLLSRYFETGWGPNADRYVVGDQVRRLISFRTLNLMAKWPMRMPMDVIMCRNVVIYFDDKTKAVLWERFADQLESDGWLFIGHSERLAGSARTRFAPAGLTTYRCTDF